MVACSASFSGFCGMKKKSLGLPSHAQSGSLGARFSTVLATSAAGAAVRRAGSSQPGIVVVASASGKSQPVMVAHVDLTSVAVVRVTPWLTLVPNEVVVMQSDASAGVHSSGFSGCSIAPPGCTLRAAVSFMLRAVRLDWGGKRNLRDLRPGREIALERKSWGQLDISDRWGATTERN